MATDTEKLVRGLWPLPGGNDRYLLILDQAIKFVAASDAPTRSALSGWLMNQYSVGKNTVNGYMQVITKLGVVDLLPDDAIQVSRFGQAVMEAGDSEKARLVVERFMQDYLAFPEVLGFYAKAEQPIHVLELGPALRDRFPDWTSDAQFENRALWLLSLGCIEQTAGRKYQITSFGREIAAKGL